MYNDIRGWSNRDYDPVGPGRPNSKVMLIITILIVLVLAVLSFLEVTAP